MHIRTYILLLTAVICMSGLVQADTQTRGVCFRDCNSCKSMCRGDAQCQNHCYQIKRLCCRMGNCSPGSPHTCSCG